MIAIYIDGANLHQGLKDLWWLDYGRFRIRLTDKYTECSVYIFLWYIEVQEGLYNQLREAWYILIFKETRQIEWKTKGNCDAELVVQAVSQYFEENIIKVVLVTGDGDFACLVKFFQSKRCAITLLAPNKRFCSYLLKKTNTPIVFLDDVYSHFKKIPQ
jgi:uncharacterized LabA/DUF88 family protein